MLEQWQSHARNYADFFGRWASPFTNLRSIYNACIPVAVVDRFRDDTEGSIFSLTAATAGWPNEYSAAVIFNVSNDIEVVRISTWTTIGLFQGTPGCGIHVFTPIIPYNPVANNIAGAFQPGLLTDKAFTIGQTIAFAGTNPVLPALWGDWAMEPLESGPVADFSHGMSRVYDPPIRIYRNRSLAVQCTHAPAGGIMLYVSISWVERPRTTP